jgi:uncharacterized protein
MNNGPALVRTLVSKWARAALRGPDWETRDRVTRTAAAPMEGLRQARLDRPLGAATSRRFTCFAALALGLISSPAFAAPIDCPLREDPFSTDLPLMDILLSPAAKLAAERSIPALKRVPPAYFSAQPPSFAAIHTLQTMFLLLRQPKPDLSQLDRELRSIPVTEVDKKARCARYDVKRPRLTFTGNRKRRILVFEKVTGVHDRPAIEAARAAVQRIAAKREWAVAVTDRGGAIHPAILDKVDVVVWNNVSGDVLTLTQRQALRRFVENGGGFVGIHSAAGDPNYYWKWYADTLIGARFVGHPPNFQDARIVIDERAGSIARGLPASWTMNDEWYSFAESARASGSHVIATLDETTYSPKSGSRDLTMGDHPIAWSRCVDNGRSFYSAIGHRPEGYTNTQLMALLENGLAWASGEGESRCMSGKEVPTGG